MATLTPAPNSPTPQAPRGGANSWLLAGLVLVLVLGLIAALVGPSELVTTLRRSLPSRAANIPAPGAATARAELEPPAMDAVNAERSRRGLAPAASDPQ